MAVKRERWETKGEGGKTEEGKWRRVNKEERIGKGQGGRKDKRRRRRECGGGGGIRDGRGGKVERAKNGQKVHIK